MGEGKAESQGKIQFAIPHCWKSSVGWHGTKTALMQGQVFS
jgi:hypothetical protein